MKLLHYLRPLVLLSLGLPLISPATDVIKTWTGANNQGLNNVLNWDNGQRPTWAAAANTDALVFGGLGNGIVNINVDATVKSVTVNGTLGYTLQNLSPLRLGDSTTTSVQPNSGFLINNSTANLALNTEGGFYFSFGKLEAAGSTITVGANSFIEIGNESAAAGRNLTITGASDITVSGKLKGLGTLQSAGGHLFKDGTNTLLLNNNSETWNGRVLINSGAIRISRAGSLGTAAGDTTVAGGASTGKLELTNSIGTDETVVLLGRSAAGIPSLVNISGNNILSSPLLLNTGGTEYTIESQSGHLTLQGGVDYGDSTGVTNVTLQGAGTGVISGVVGAGGDPLALTKAGTGTWDLYGANSFTGAIQVNAGKLNIATAHAAQNAITVADGAALGISVTQPGQSLNATALNVSGTSGTALAFDLGALGNPSVPVLNTSSLTVTGVVGVSLKGSGLSIGQIPLIDYQGSIGGAGFEGLSLVEVPARVTATLVNDAVNTRVLLNVSGFDTPRWTGAIDANWDANDGSGTGTFNWKELVSGSLTRYLQGTGGTDAVLFDDTAEGSTNVTLTTALTPASIVVNNVSKNYTFSGPGNLGGTGKLTKKGGGSLTLLNTTANAYSGETVIEAGTVTVGDGVTSTSGSLGTGPVANGGTLIFNRPDDYAFGGAISGAGGFIKLGAGTVTLSGNSSFTSPVNVNAGTLKLGNPNALGDISGETAVAEGASLDIGGQLLPAGEVVTVTGHGVGAAGAVVNTGTGGAAVGLKNLVFAGPSSIGGSGRWDIRDNPGGVNVNGHDLTKTGSNVVQWVNIGEAHIGNLTINGPGSRFTLGGNTTQGDRPGVIRVESGAQLGLEESTVPITKPIFVDLGTINATGGTTNVINSDVQFTGALTLNSAAATEIVFNGKITGDGSLTKTTGGIVKLTSDQNSYPGITTNSTGPLWLGNDTPTGNLPPGDIVNNGNLVVRRIGEPFTLAHNISGTGQITIGNANFGEDTFKVTLTGANSFAGNVTVARGRLHIHQSNALGAGAKIVAIQSARRPTLVLEGGETGIDLSSDLSFNTSSDDVLGAIYNVSGNNIIRGQINLRNGGGGNTRIRSDGGSLTLAGNLIAAADATSARTLFLDGSSADSVVTGSLLNGLGTPPNVVPQSLSVTKQGTGRWTLHSGANTYLGATTISAGTLKLAATASIATSPTITLTTGAIFDVEDVANFTLASGQNLNGTGHVQGCVRLGTGSFITPGSGTTAGTHDISGNLTLGGGRARFNLVTDTTRGSDINDLVTVGGNLVFESASTLELQTTGAPLAGSYRLIEYTGDLVGDVASLTLVNPTRYSVALDTATDGQVNLVIGGQTGNLVWTGNGTTNVWDNNISQSWSGSGATFLAVDGVTFDDSADPARRTVTLTGGLVPSFIHVNTNAGYTFSGTGSITGTASLLKEGTGVLTLNTASNWQGKTDIRSGSVVLGATAALAQTRWIELHPGTTLDVAALTAGLNFGNTTDPRVLSGNAGTISGIWLVGGVSVVKPGLASNSADRLTAGDQIGNLHFNGNLTLQTAATAGFPRLVLQLAGAAGHVANALDFEAVSAFASTVTTSHDQITVSGILALDDGSTIRLETTGGYVPELGDVFNLADWAQLNLDANANGTGFDPSVASSFDLPALPEGLFWNRSLFTTHGLLFISPEPPLVGLIQVAPGDTVNPGTQVTLSISADGLEPYTYQWKRNNENILNATQATLIFNATEADQGSYTVVVSNPAGPTSSAAVLLTVNDPVQFAVPLQNQSVNPGSDVTFTAQVTGTGPFTYQWRKNTQNLENQTGDSLSLISVTEADQASYDVVVTNIVGSQTSLAAALSVNDPVSIVQDPQPQGALLEGSATFTVGVAGTGPFTYRWIKNGVDIPGAAAAEASLTLTNITEESAGDYSVRVTNIAGNVISLAAPLIVVTDEPKIVSLSPSRLVAVGGAATLQVNAVGQPPLKYQWFKGTVKIATGIQAQLALANVQIKDAGAYRVEVTSGATTPVSSGNVEVGVVDTAAKAVVTASGGTTKLEVKTAGNGLTYAWKKDDVSVVPDARVTGTDRNILSIGKPLGDEDSGLYTLVVNGPGGSVTTQGHLLSVFSEAPEITENPPVFPAAIVGGEFTPYTIPVNPDSKKTPTAFAASGLPPGLKIDTKTGRITGKPTAISKDPLGYLVKLTASNTKGKSIVEGRLLVQDLPANVIGYFVAPIGRQAVINGGLGGRLELTVSKTAAFTGKLFLGAVTYPLKGALAVTPAVGEAISTQSGQQIIIRKGLSNLTLSVVFDAPNNRISSAQVTDGSATVSFTGWRNKWSKTTPATTAFGTYHTFALEIPGTWAGNDAVPQGNGYGAFTIAADGKLSIAGKLADGEALTNAGFVGPDGEIAVFKTLYTTKDKGSIVGTLDLDAPALDGEITWSRPVNPSDKHRLYRAGFPDVITLTAVGGQYVAPVAPLVFLNLDAGDHARLILSEGGIEGFVAALTDLDIDAIIGAKSKVTLPPNAAVNPRKPTLTLTDKTGLIKGGFNLENANPVSVGKVVKQAVKFEGVAVRHGADLKGAGFFLLPQLPSEATPVNTPILSGQVTVEVAE